VEDPVQALKPLVKQLQGKANLIVLLSHAPFAESIEIAKCFPEVGLIITGHNIEEPIDSITYINNTPIVSSGTEGKYIGIAKYAVNNAVMERKSVGVIPLDNKYKDSQEMISLLKEYQQMLADEDLLSKIPQTPLLNGLSYVGSSICGMCHKVVYEHWSKTTHGTSYGTLVRKGYQYDPECIKCHTTGYGDISGFLNYEKNNNLINVGCESCHGAGSRHIKYVTETYGVTDESDCVICHESEHSPKFQYNEYWKKIKHPEEIVKKIPKTTE
jgi:Cytochrome c554 and c-prime